MRILVVGGSGTIGRAVVDALAARHEVVTAGRGSGDLRVDYTSGESVRAMYARVGTVDAVVSCAGGAAFNALAKLTDAELAHTLSHKLMGQVNLVRHGLDAVADGGSFTLSSGVLNREPIPGSAAIAMVNSALEGFAVGAAIEMPRGIRINVVSPPWVSETLRQMGQDPAGGMPAAEVARAYVAAVEGGENGRTIDARDLA